jgi:BirA family transcriptional regulator, biotin operon repressor / biotin---[acetyl-CoA-carboxylase] ligase
MSDSQGEMMATPYLQVRLASVGSTQDEARARLEDLPVLVLAPVQIAGRGRSGTTWETAPRALAASLALRLPVSDRRPFSLMAGVAAVRAVEGVRLKWPNDVMVGPDKCGGILVERADEVVVVGLGLNLWWPSPPEGFGSLLSDDPGEDRHAEIGALWGAELMRLLDSPGWPIEEYTSHCSTLGRDITWDPDGSGRAVGIGEDGGLIVETSQGRRVIDSGAIRHVR